MNWRCKQVGLAVLVLACASVVWAAGPQPIGFAAGEASFTAGSSVVQGLATIFEGDSLRSASFSTRLNLKNGSRYVLGVGSEAAIYRDYLLLRSGSVEINGGVRPARVRFGRAEVLAGSTGSAATIYAIGKDRFTVLPRSGEVKLVPAQGGNATTLRNGEFVSFKQGPKGLVRMDPEEALVDLAQVQAEQVAAVNEAARDYSCLAPKAREISRSFAALSSGLAVNQAARGAIQTKISTGRATSSDLQTLAGLNNNLGRLYQTSASLSGDLDDAVFQFHHPGPTEPFSSPHSVHGHVNTNVHHGQHGHTIPPPYPNGPYGHHQVPPHNPG